MEQRSQTYNSAACIHEIGYISCFVVYMVYAASLSAVVGFRHFIPLYNQKKKLELKTKT